MGIDTFDLIVAHALHRHCALAYKQLLNELQLIAKKVGVSADDPAMDALLEPMEPEKLVEQIKSANEESAQERKAGK